MSLSEKAKQDLLAVGACIVIPGVLFTLCVLLGLVLDHFGLKPLQLEGDALQVDKDTHLHRVKVSEDVRVLGYPGFPALTITESHIEGKLKFFGDFGEISLDNTDLVKSMLVSDLLIGRANANWTHTVLEFDQVTAKEPIEFENVTINGSVQVTDFQGTLRFLRCTITTDVTIENIEAKLFSLRGSNARNLHLAGCVDVLDLQDFTWSGKLDLSQLEADRILVDAESAERIQRAAPKIPLVY